MHIIVLLKRLKKLPGLGTLFVGKGREVLGNVPNFAGDDAPTIGLEPRCDCRGGSTVSDETSSLFVCGNIIVLLVGQGLDLIGTCLDGSLLGINGGIIGVGFYSPTWSKRNLLLPGAPN